MTKETAMADPAEQVTLRLTFWHKNLKPGDTVQVRRDEIPMWRGFAVPVEDEPQDTPATDDTSASEPAPAKAPTTTASKAK